MLMADYAKKKFGLCSGNVPAAPKMAQTAGQTLIESRGRLPLNDLLNFTGRKNSFWLC